MPQTSQPGPEHIIPKTEIQQGGGFIGAESPAGAQAEQYAQQYTQEQQIPAKTAASQETSPGPIPEQFPGQETAPARPEQNREYAGISTVEEKNILDETIDGLKRALRITPKKKGGPIPVVRDDITIQVEKIMEDGLKDAYKEMTPVQQQEFKIKGEQTAAQIRMLLRATHVKVKKVFQLLVEWLKLLPGVNRFFIEQEAKIKSDKILAIKERQRDK